MRKLLPVTALVVCAFTVAAEQQDFRTVHVTLHEGTSMAAAFSSDRSGSYDVWVLTLTTGDIRQVTFGPANEFQPSWRRDSSELVFVSDRSGKPGVYAVGVAAG